MLQTTTDLSYTLCACMCAFSLIIVILSCQTAVASLFDSKTETLDSTNSQTPKTQKNQPKRDKVLLIGTQGSGKTLLMYKLASKQEQATVSSHAVNQTSFQENEQSEPINLVDIPGHYNFKKHLKVLCREAKKIVFLVDSKEYKGERLGQAGDILYDVLSNVDLASACVPILIACNKQDLTPFARRAVALERDLQGEIESLKKVKQAQREHENENITNSGQTA